MKYLISFLVLLFSITTLAAPFPATSSSDFLKSDWGMFRSIEGFSIHAKNTAWIHTETPKKNKYIATLYKAPQIKNGVQALMTVRVDKLKKKISLKRYMKKWLNDYPRLGFSVLASKPIKVNGQRAFLVDVINRHNSKQLRQIIFLKNQRAVVLTCRDHKKSFRSTVKDCNQIVRNFSWI